MSDGLSRRPFPPPRLVPLTRDGFEAVHRRNAGILAALGFALIRVLRLVGLPDVAGVGVGLHQLAGLVRLPARELKPGVGVGAEGERLAPTVEGIVEAPPPTALRPAFRADEEIETVAVVQAKRLVMGLGRPDGGIRGNQVPGHCSNSHLENPGKTELLQKLLHEMGGVKGSHGTSADDQNF